MLQQTQVARVVPRYLEWLERWPTAAALAAASRGEVLAAWVGLGYNRRALALHAAATVVARDGWPDDLETLPGVGAYTAAAVGSFAFGAQVAAVDTNARRVAARLGRGGPAALLPAGGAADWNQAVMELGATVCTARAPRCDACPVAAWCAGAAVAGRPGDGRPGGAAVAVAGRPGGAAVAAASAAASGAPGGGGGCRPAERFEDTNRFVRGRVVAALAAGEGLPRDIAPERLERAVAGLVRDGLVRPVKDGFSLG
jgi:A/G-specific adenine glycosylase